MDLQQLIAFDRIVREGSFSRAARELQIAQPTISARMQALEAEVGGVLLEASQTVGLVGIYEVVVWFGGSKGESDGSRR